MALDPETEEYRGTARAAWDDDFLYTVFEVASGKPMRNAGDDPATAFKTGDTVELFLSVNENPLADRHPRGANLDTAKAGDYRILMTLLRNTRPVVFGFDFVNPANNQNRTTFQISGPKAVVDHAAPVVGAVMAVRKAAVNGVDGFVVEAKIPWKYFRSYKPKEGARLLCNLAVNFSNQSGTATMGKAYWNGPSHMTEDLGVEAQIHPEHWGWLELTKSDSTNLFVASVAASQDTVGLQKTAREPVLLTPPPGPSPKINGPKVYACGPRHPLLYRIPATGKRPMQFAAEGLPAGLALNADSGIIRGRIAEKGDYRVTLRATNVLGQAVRPLKIVCGDTLALTPPMGWNSWYIHYDRVSEAHLREAARRMIASGMADYGYQYVNIDGCWTKKQGDKPYRDAQGAVLPGRKFPDIKGMVDEIHAAGLKAGIYASPGPWDCAGYVGAYQHEAADARKFAQWGFDFLKYDWCSYSNVAGGSDLAHLKKPYQLIAVELKKQDRDIVLNLCQYGMGEVWKWGGEVGQCWRTTGDLGLERGSRLPGFYSVAFSNSQHWENAKPGCWNDPDYLLIGYVGDASSMGAGRKTTLTPSEQYSYMSLWCLMAAPLIFSGDMARLDPLTLSVLCNAEVIDVDQDALGRQGRIVRKTPGEFVLLKDLEDGSKALGLFNLGEAEATISVAWSDLGLNGKQQVRDLWRQKDLPTGEEKFQAAVPRHGVTLVKIRPAK